MKKGEVWLQYDKVKKEKCQKSTESEQWSDKKNLHVKETVGVRQAAHKHNWALSKPLLSWLGLHEKNSSAV